MSDIQSRSIELHKKHKGKLRVEGTVPLENSDDLSLAYSPGVGAVSSAIADGSVAGREVTGLGNTVAIISDGSAVLGLGDIGPVASLPVMEGKAALFKRFAGIDGVPIVLDVHTADEIVAAVEAIAPSFGGINLEDIAGPLCFEVEDRLKESLDMPLMHDDQHGTAIVILAGLINAAKVTNRSIAGSKIVVVGAGAAGTAAVKLLKKYEPSIDIAVFDSRGMLATDRDDMNSHKQGLAELSEKNKSASLEEALENADVFIGVSKAGLLTEELVSKMADDPIVFGLANPVPEIMPEVAKNAGVAVIATGRSDFPNQVNNAVAFPGIFRGALDNGVSKITDEHKIAAAEAIASLINEPTADQIIPDVFDERLVNVVSRVITK